MSETRVRNLVVRATGITTRRPRAPRELSYDETLGLLSWKAPADRGFPFTHYRIRVDTDGGEPDFELSAGQTSLQFRGSAAIYLSTYNSTNGLESTKVTITVTASSPDEEIPGDVQAIGSDPFLIAVSESGGQATVSIEYDPPATIGSFAGVTFHNESPDGAEETNFSADYDYNGDPEGSGDARHGTLNVVLPRPTASITNRAYLTSRSKRYKKSLGYATGASPSPSRTYDLTAYVATDTPLAPNVTPVTTGDDACRVVTETHGDRFTWHLAGSVIAHTNDANYPYLSYIKILGFKNGQSDRPLVAAIQGPDPGLGDVIVYFEFEPCEPPASEESWVLEFQAWNTAGALTADSPQVSGLTVPHELTTAAPNPQSFALVNLGWDETFQNLVFPWVVRLPVDRSNFYAFKICCTTPDVTNQAMTGLQFPADADANGDIFGTILVARRDAPATAEDWTFNCIPINADRHENTSGFLSQAITTAELPEDTAAPDVEAFEVGTANQDGTFEHEAYWSTDSQSLLFDWGCLLPTDITHWSAMAVWIRTPDGEGGYDYRQATGVLDASMFLQDSVSGAYYYRDTISISGKDLPKTAETWRFIAVSYNAVVSGTVPAPNMSGGVVTGPWVDITTPTGPAAPPATDVAGKEHADLVTGYTAVRTTPVVFQDKTNFSGNGSGETFGITAEFTDPASTRYTACRLYMTYDDDPAGTRHRLTGNENTTTDPLKCGPWPMVQTTAFGIKIWFVSRRGELENTIVAGVTPCVSITITPQGAGPINAGNIDATTLHGSLAVELGKLSIAAGGVSTDRLAELAVTAAKLADGSVENAKLADAAVTTAKLQNLAVDNSKLAALAVDAAKLADSAVTATKIANAAVGYAAIAVAAIGTIHIQTGAIISAHIGTAQIGTAHIQYAAIGSAAIAAAAIGTAHIQDAAITNAKIVSLEAAKITAGTLAAGVIYGGTINADQINAGTVNVGSGGMTFSGTGGVVIAGGGNISVLAGYVTGSIVRCGLGGFQTPYASGATGSFQSADGKTVSVQYGITTSIA